jgi:uncharacterized membrane protein
MADREPRFHLSEGGSERGHGAQPGSPSTKGNRPGSKWTDERVDQILGTLLQTGVMVSGLVVLAGGILYLLHNGHVAVHYESFSADREAFRGFALTVGDALRGNGRAIIECGLLLLIATPVARVVFSIVAFALERERLYIVVTLIVFLILIYSLFGGAS